jgi:predicted AlkP superfamily phosphohydrolase/phosphomutase/tetratricopeptide (TPR) repeat protein
MDISNNTSSFKKKVLLIGWDAADWKVINPLIDAGKMPHLARMVNRGVMGNIATLQPVLSPMLWTSIATGKRPYKHGIYGFSEPDPVTGGIRPVTNLSRKTKAVWNILNQNGLNTITIGWWPSNPAEPLSKGVMVSNDYQMAQGKTASSEDLKNWPIKPGAIHPERLIKPLKKLRFHPAELTEEDLRPFLPGLEGMSREELDKAQKDPRVQSLMKIIADCTSVHSAATATMQNEPWDLMCVYYDAIDHFGHAFMKYHPPQQKQVNDWDYRLFNYCVEAGYRYHDMMLGTLLDLAGEDTTVILLSDHGFHPDEQRLENVPREPAGPAAEHRQFGIFAAKGPGIREDERVYGTSLLDICPTLLHLFDLPVGEDMDGNVLLDIYKKPPTHIDRIPSWDEVDGDHGMHPPDQQISADDSKAALEQLIALGYIEEPNADKSKAMELTVRELDYNLAQAYLDGGIYSDAIAILERLYEKWPMEHRFGFKLASCYQATGRSTDLRKLVQTITDCRMQEAADAIAEIKSLHLDDEEVQKLAEEEFEKKSPREQRKWSRERRELFAKARPNLFSLRYLEASSDLSEKNYEGALSKLEKLDGDFGARRNLLTLRGEIYQRLKRWPESRTCFEAALAMEEETPGPWLGLARTFLAEKNYRETIAHARASIGLLFFQPRAHYILGLAHYRLGQWKDAEQAFLICARQAPLFSAAYRMLGQIAQWYKKDTSEIVFYKKMVKTSRQQLRKRRIKKRTEFNEGINQMMAHNTPIRTMPELDPHLSTLREVPANQIITIVSGLPRSGTSLMMQVLEAAGIPPFTDGHRTADESNPKGYYEHDNVPGLLTSRNKAWIREAKGASLKVVAPLLSALPAKIKALDPSVAPPEKLHYRVLFMEREIEEILESQTSMLNRLGKDTPKGDVSKAYFQQVRHAKNWCVKSGVSAMSVNYADLVHSPESILKQLEEFLGVDDKLSSMQAVINPSLHRAKKIIKS